MFTTVPRPITLNDDVPIGTTVTTLIATDSDGTSPGNKVTLPDFFEHFYVLLDALLYPEQQSVKDIGKPEQKCQLCYKLCD